MAVRVGFEPTEQLTSLYGLANRYLRPLGHLTIYYGGQGEIRTHGPFRADSFQDCSDKPDSGTYPKMVDLRRIELLTPRCKRGVFPLALQAQYIFLEHYYICTKKMTDNLSYYTPSVTAMFWCLVVGSNHRPTPYQDAALPLS